MNNPYSFEEYILLKNIIYELYPVFEKMSPNERETFFINRGKLGKVAKYTFLYPNDFSLLQDFKERDMGIITDDDIIKKYQFDEEVLNIKDQEFHIYQFEKLLYIDNGINMDALNRVENQRKNEIKY